MEIRIMKHSVGIIGGGIAGLTAAYRLREAGFEVTVLEKSDRVGGAMYSRFERGYLSETGPNTILETSPKVTDLVRDLGIEADKVYANDTAKNRYIVRDRKPVPLPTGPMDFFRTPLFSWKAKLRLFGEPFIPAWDNSYEESLAEFVVRRLGHEFLEYAINPFVAGVYAGDPDILSARHGFPKLYALEQTYGGLIKGQIKGARARRKSGETAKTAARMFSFSEGLKMLPDRFEEILGDHICKQTSVRGIRKTGEDWEITYQVKSGDSKTLTCGTVLYAGRAADLRQIQLNGVDSEDFFTIAQTYHPPVSVLSLGFRREDVEHPLDGFGVLIPKVEEMNTLGVLFSSSMFENRAPEGRVLLTVFIGGTRNPSAALLSKDDLVALAMSDLTTILGVDGDPDYINHLCWKKAIPQYQVGYGKTKDQIDTLEAENPGLYFTGNYRNGISVADTIVNASDVTSRIIESKN